MFPNQIFCKVDDGLIELIKKLANGRTVVDCGCGVGLLGHKMGRGVISVDVMHREGELVDVVRMDVMKFPFLEGHLPVFLRPCHGHFVEMALERLNRDDVVWDALYVSMPHNFKIDVPEWCDVEEIPGWVGADGEHAYRIEFKGRYPGMDEWWLVKLDMWRMPSWMQFDGSWLRNSGGGGFPYKEGSVQVLKKAKAHSARDLDWSGTGFDDPESGDGWLAPDGKFWGCSYMGHDHAAYYALKFNDANDACAHGYARIHERGTFEPGPWYTFGDAEDVKLTEAQQKWLTEKGIEIMEHHLP